MSKFLILVLCYLPLFCNAQMSWFVSPEGLPENKGTIDSPWDIITAFNSSQIQNGDSILLREGIYPLGNGIHIGTAVEGQPVTVMPYKYESVIIEGYANDDGSGNINLNISSPSVIVRDLIFTEASKDRVSNIMHSNPADIPVSMGANVRDPNTKLINCIFLNITGTAINSPGGAHNAEIYGNIVVNNGWWEDSETRKKGHGHSLYFQNENGRKKVENNVFIKPYGYGMQFYSAGSAGTEGSDVISNIAISAGSLADETGTTGAYNYLIESQGDGSVTNMHRNHSYHIDRGTGFSVGHIKVSDLCDFRGNYVLGGSKGLVYWNYKHVVARNNTVVMKNFKTTGYNYDIAHIDYPDIAGDFKHDIDSSVYYTDDALFPYTGGGSFENWKETYKVDSNGTIIYVSSFEEVPNNISVIPNKYEKGRGHIVIYNHQLLAEVEVDVSTIFENSGVNYWLYDLEDLRQPIQHGTIGSDYKLKIPTNQSTVLPLKGTELHGAPVHSKDDFGSFLIMGRELYIGQAGETYLTSSEFVPQKCYPNPASQFIYIEGDERKHEIRIVDISGKILEVIHANGGLMSVNIAQLEDGLYIFHINDGKNKWVERVLKN